jgi:hypothetical protein
MEKRVNEVELVAQIERGDYTLFSKFYVQNRERFINSFAKECRNTEDETGNRRPKFMRGDLYLDEMYQDSNMRMIEKIHQHKLYVKEGYLYTINKNGEQKAYMGGLYGYLYKIGVYILREMERSERNVSTVDIDDLMATTAYLSEDCECQVMDNNYEDALIDPYEEEDDRISLIREIVKDMRDPCKSLFRVTYYEGGEKRKKWDTIASMLGYVNAEVARVQHFRCFQKFKNKFNSEYKRKDN